MIAHLIQHHTVEGTRFDAWQQPHHAVSPSPEIFWPFVTIGLTVLQFWFWPKTFAIKFYNITDYVNAIFAREIINFSHTNWRLTLFGFFFSSFDLMSFLFSCWLSVWGRGTQFCPKTLQEKIRPDCRLTLWDATEIQNLTLHLFPLFPAITGAIAFTSIPIERSFHGGACRENCVAKACHMAKL